MKKVLITAHDLNVGGIENSLINLLHNIDYKKYQITLLLQKKEGKLLEFLPSNIEIINYNLYNKKTFVNKITNDRLNKLINKVKLFLCVKKIQKKYDYSICFTTWCYNSSYLALRAADKKFLWLHANYLTFYNNDIALTKKTLDGLFLNEYTKLVCVSKNAMLDLIKVYPEYKSRFIVCNNIIDYKAILKKYNFDFIESIKKDKGYKFFLNVSRHSEKEKSITRIINAAKKLNEEKYRFKVFLVGDGPDTEMYKNMVEQMGLKNEIVFLGAKKNPYPYFKNMDAHILCSNSEGSPMILKECMVLNVPIITTNISDVKDEVENKFGIIINKNDEGVYSGMKEIIENGYNIKEKFDAKLYNKEIIRIFDSLFD